MNPALAGRDMGWNPGSKQEKRYLHIADQDVMNERLKLADMHYEQEIKPKLKVKVCLQCQSANSPIAEHWARFTELGSEVHTRYHQVFYAHLNPGSALRSTEVRPTPLGQRFFDEYHAVLAMLRDEHFKEPFYFQTIPSVRIQLPNNVAVARPHRDTEGGHLPEEVNIFMPFTRAQGSSTVWAESESGKGDYTPLDAVPGELIVWDGANLRHGNKENETGLSRLSVDFRVLPVRSYVEREGFVSLTMQMPMKPGHYFDGPL